MEENNIELTSFFFFKKILCQDFEGMELEEEVKPKQLPGTMEGNM